MEPKLNDYIFDDNLDEMREFITNYMKNFTQDETKKYAKKNGKTVEECTKEEVISFIKESHYEDQLEQY
jgi:L-lactate utilization protein LutC